MCPTRWHLPPTNSHFTSRPFNHPNKAQQPVQPTSMSPQTPFSLQNPRLNSAPVLLKLRPCAEPQAPTWLPTSHTLPPTVTTYPISPPPLQTSRTSPEQPPACLTRASAPRVPARALAIHSRAGSEATVVAGLGRAPRRIVLMRVCFCLVRMEEDWIRWGAVRRTLQGWWGRVGRVLGCLIFRIRLRLLATVTRRCLWSI